MADKGFTIRDELAAVRGLLFYDTSFQVKGSFLKRRQSITRKLPVSGFMWSDIWKD